MENLSFDDLVPPQGNTTGPTFAGTVRPRQAMTFDDLIPQPQTVASDGKSDRADYQAPSVGMDVLRSAGTGLRQGVESLVGMAGDAQNLAGRAGGFVAEQFGASPEAVQMATNFARLASPLPPAPTTEQVREQTTQVIGENYQPQTTAGQYAKTVGEFAPAAVAGPGGVARKAAMTVVPAVASEAAGQSTEGTDAEPYARAAAAILGGAVTAGRKGSALGRIAKDAPTPEALRAQKRAAYDALKQSGVVFDPQALSGQVSNVAARLTSEGLQQALAPKTYSILASLDDGIRQGGIVDFNAIEAARKTAGRLVRSADGEERAAAAIVRDALDDFTTNAPLVNQGGMPRREFLKLQKEARDLARRDIQQKVLSDILEGAQDYASGVEAGVRNQVNSLLRSKRGKQLFRSPAEKAALRRVAQDRKTLQQLSRFGFDVTGGAGNAALIPTLTAGAGALTGNPLAIAATAGGTVAKVASPMLTKRAFEKAQAIVRAGPKAQAQAMSQEEVEALEVFIRRAIAANNARLSAQ
jgi:hypothetical protein